MISRTSSIAPRRWATLIYASTAGVVVLGASSGAVHGLARATLILCAAALGVVQVVAQQRREQAASDVAEETRTLTNNAISYAFTPLLATLADFVDASDPLIRAQIKGELRTSTVYAASLAIGPDHGVRACLFEVDDPSDPQRLSWSHVYAGRGDQPKSTFSAGTTRGDALLSMLRDNTYAFCEDTETDPPPGWQEHPHEYRTFLAVPIHANGRGLGMLTVDSLTSGDLKAERDRPILEVLARILAAAAVEASP